MASVESSAWQGREVWVRACVSVCAPPWLWGGSQSTALKHDVTRAAWRWSTQRWSGQLSLTLPKGGLWVSPGLGRTQRLKLKTAVFGVHSLSYYCSIVIYKTVWDMEISHATLDMAWVKAHWAIGPLRHREVVCKGKLSQHFGWTIYSCFWPPCHPPLEVCLAYTNSTANSTCQIIAKRLACETHLW